MRTGQRIRQALRTSPGIAGYALLVLALVLSLLVQGPSFFAGWNVRSVLGSNTPLIIVCMAQMIAILAGGIDLSVGSTMALANALAIVLTNDHQWSTPAGWAAALLACTAVGVCNGAIIAYARVSPILTTLCTLSLVQGVALFVLPKPGGQVPPSIYTRYSGSVLGMPTTLWIIAAMLLLWRTLSGFPLGNHIRAVGGNERSACACGIPTERVKLVAYGLAGLYAGVAGLCLTALTAAGDPRIGIPFTLKSVAGVVLGGTLFASGWGSMGGTVAGALFLGLVNCVVFFALSRVVDLVPGYVPSPYVQHLVSSAVIVFALATSGVTCAWQDAAQRRQANQESTLRGAAH